MAEILNIFVDSLPISLLPLIGIVVSVVLFVLFRRNRNRDRLTRLRFLVLFVLMLVHTFLYILGVLSGPYIDILAFPWIALVPVMLIVQILYLVHLNQWDNHDLRIATTALAFYNVPLFFLAFFMFLAMGFHD